ncbi:MAG: hypothetical protein ABR977_00245 [Candidatus Dormibacteria bacterium]|jgi:hypothetical protein
MSTFIQLTSDGNGNLLWLNWHRIVYMYPDDVEDNRVTRRVTVLVLQDLADDLWVQETPEQIAAMVDSGAQRPDWLDSPR